MALAEHTPDSTFVTAVANLVNPDVTTKTIYRKTALVVGANVTEYDDPSVAEPKALSMGSLRSVVDFVKSNYATGTLEDVFVHVKSPTRVEIVVPFVGEMRQNLVYAVAEPVLPRLRLGEFLDPEAFLIGLMSGFVDTPERRAVQANAGGFKAGLMAEIEDDGVSVSVQTKSKLTRSTTVKIDGAVLLAPFRTFPEVEQPASDFLLRAHQIKSGESISVEVALFEADGGRWRAIAMDAIGDYFRGEFEGIAVTILA